MIFKMRNTQGIQNCILECEFYTNSNLACMVQIKSYNLFWSRWHSRNFVLIQWYWIKMSAVKMKLTNEWLNEKCEVFRHIEKGTANKEASRKIWSAKKYYFNEDKKQRETFLCAASNFIVYQKNM